MKSESILRNGESALRRAAMDYLARREHSFYELKKKLHTKFPQVKTDVIHDVVHALRVENLQNDERFVESYSRYRKSRGFGYRHIRHALKLRKVENKQVDKYLVLNDSEWVELAISVIRKKWGGRGPAEMTSIERSKIIRFMESRGFLFSQIDQAMTLL